MLWDIFCRVIDNFGDMGVCWRLSADLAQRGQEVRLWVDDASALRWMAPDQQAVQVRPWDDAAQHPPQPGDVVIEAFGCDPPDAFVHHMQDGPHRSKPPCWINLEYLSAEDYVERSHGLMSPVWSGPGAGLRKWFFYPGFTPATGGLLRETDLLAQRDAFLADPSTRLSWLASQGLDVHDRQRRYVTVFCYDSAPLPDWLDMLSMSAEAEAPVTLLLTPGPATRLAREWQQAHVDKLASLRNAGVLLYELPHLTQTEFDRLLWSCDLNLVRGEDSAVRALWAGKPHIWQIYEQDDGVHAGKLDAFLDLWLSGWDASTAQAVRQIWYRWNRLDTAARVDDPQRNPLQNLLKLASGTQAGHPANWPDLSRQASQKLANQADLVTQLLQFVSQTG